MKKPRRRATSKKERRTILAAWRKSGQSAARYSEEHGIGSSCLWRWQREQDSAQSPQTFLRLESDSESKTIGAGHLGRVEIELPSGPIVRLSGQVNVDDLVALLRSLASS